MMVAGRQGGAADVSNDVREVRCAVLRLHLVAAQLQLVLVDVVRI